MSLMIEEHTGSLRGFGLSLVLLVDSAQMDENPGTVRWLEWQDTSGMSGSTHTLPPYPLAEFLRSDLGCMVALLGIQPRSNAMRTSITPVMQGAVDGIGDALFGR